MVCWPDFPLLEKDLQMSSDAQAILDRWATAFARSDGAAIAALYTPDAIFIGGIDGINLGQEGIKAYFAANVSDSTIVFRDIVIRPQGPDAAIVAMIGAIRQ